MRPPLNEITIECLPAQYTWKRCTGRTIVKCSPYDKITILAMYPSCKSTSLNTHSRCFKFHLSKKSTLSTTVTIVSSHIRDTDGLRHCSSQSDTFYEYRW